MKFVKKNTIYKNHLIKFGESVYEMTQFILTEIKYSNFIINSLVLFGNTLYNTAHSTNSIAFYSFHKNKYIIKKFFRLKCQTLWKIMIPSKYT